MANTNTMKGQISCPNCGLSGKYNFEKKTICSARTPYTPGVYDSTIELQPKTVYCCINCGYGLGQPDNEPLNTKAIQFVERQKRLEAKRAASEPKTDGEDSEKGPEKPITSPKPTTVAKTTK